MKAELELVFDAPREVEAWVAERCDNLRGEIRTGGYQAVGVSRRGRLVGGAVWHNVQNDVSVEMTIAGKGAWVDRNVVSFFMWNSFIFLGCAHVWCRTGANNKRAISGLLRVGFVVEGVQRTAWDGVTDAVLLGLTKKNAEAWIGGEHGE